MHAIRHYASRSAGSSLVRLSSTTARRPQTFRGATGLRLLLPFLAGVGVTAYTGNSRLRSSFARTDCEGGDGRSNHVGATAALTKIIHLDDALDEESFRKLIEGAEQKFPGLPVFVLFTAEKCDGVSWCGDSNRAEPLIISALETFRPDCVLVVCAVKRSEYKGPSYSYRDSPIIKLRSVPTLQRYGAILPLLCRSILIFAVLKHVGGEMVEYQEQR